MVNFHLYLMTLLVDLFYLPTSNGQFPHAMFVCIKVIHKRVKTQCTIGQFNWKKTQEPNCTSGVL
jgi:hypothetical protein